MVYIDRENRRSNNTLVGKTNVKDKGVWNLPLLSVSQFTFIFFKIKYSTIIICYRETYVLNFFDLIIDIDFIS